MRIGAGWAKGQKLASPKGQETRPTSDKVRAAIFNALQGEIATATVLDLFAGTGALGLEALSRGAQSAVFVDTAKASQQAIKTNTAELKRRAAVQSLPIPDCQILTSDVLKFRPQATFSLIFADPPYALTEDFLSGFVGKLPGCSAVGTVFVLESAAGAPEKEIEGWEMYRDKSYGDTMVRMWIRRS